MIEQSWFELVDARRRNLDKAVWIPLRCVQYLRQEGKRGYKGYVEEFYGVGSLAVFSSKRKAAADLEWGNIGISHEHGGWVQDGRYVPADQYETSEGDSIGIHLVLDQAIRGEDLLEWHLHQDLVVTLALKREGDVWLAPAEGYVEVANLQRRDSGKPSLLRIRAEFLKDYLCARDMALYVTSYRNREEVVDDVGHISWIDSHRSEIEGGNRWQGGIYPIHEGGDPYGASAMVLHVTRTDLDLQDDVPAFDPPGTGKSRSWTRTFQGDKLYVVAGELWKTEWIEPGPRSARIRGDCEPSSMKYYIDAVGTQADGDALRSGGRWLWFRPEIVLALLSWRNSSLEWYTRDTGGVGCSPDCNVHFGINDIGLINVYAKDIAILPQWQQRIWSGYNTTPEGGVSEELMDAQVKACPAPTQAPEALFPAAMERINFVAKTVHGVQIYREHQRRCELLVTAHRFRSIDQPGFFALAKDLARLTVESIDVGAIQQVTRPAKREKWKSLKFLEALVALHVGADSARSLLSVLVGIYELRHADAHLPSSSYDEAFELAEIDMTHPYMMQGYEMLRALVAALRKIGDAIEQPIGDQ